MQGVLWMVIHRYPWEPFNLVDAASIHLILLTLLIVSTTVGICLLFKLYCCVPLLLSHTLLEWYCKDCSKQFPSHHKKCGDCGSVLHYRCLTSGASDVYNNFARHRHRCASCSAENEEIIGEADIEDKENGMSLQHTTTTITMTIVRPYIIIHQFAVYISIQVQLMVHAFLHVLRVCDVGQLPYAEWAQTDSHLHSKIGLNHDQFAYVYKAIKIQLYPYHQRQFYHNNRHEV